MTSITVTQDPETGTYRVLADDQFAGLTQYIDRGIERIFVHTETEPGFEGQGLATELIREALTATRAEGKRIVAVCPFVAAYVRHHHDFDDILDQIQPHHPRQA
jgi:predicted GNAT family acetyltransferase